MVSLLKGFQDIRMVEGCQGRTAKAMMMTNGITGQILERGIREGNGRECIREERCDFSLIRGMLLV